MLVLNIQNHAFLHKINLMRIIILCCIILLSNDLFAQTGDHKFDKMIDTAKVAYEGKNYQAALDGYEAALKLDHSFWIQYINYNVRYHDYNILYFAACCASRLGDFNKATTYLEKSIDYGFLDKPHLLQNTDFELLKQKEIWSKLLMRLDAKINAVERRFTAVKSVNISTLVPFLEGANWGYLDKATKKVIIKPEYRYVKFGGDCLILQVDHQQLITVNGEGKINSYYPKEVPDKYSFAPKDDVIPDTTRGFKGFKVDQNGRLTHASTYYDTPEEVASSVRGWIDDETPIVHSPVKLGDIWYAIAKKNGQYGLINQNGIIHHKLGFKFLQLELMKDTKNSQVWYFFIDAKKAAGFINLKGEIKFNNEIDNLTKEDLENSGFAAVKKGEMVGVIDLVSMEWALLPGKYAIKIARGNYVGACAQELDRIKDHARFQYWYFYDSINGCFIDKNGEKYLPLE